MNELVLVREIERDRYAWLHCRADAGLSSAAVETGDAAALAHILLAVRTW